MTDDYILIATDEATLTVVQADVAETTGGTEATGESTDTTISGKKIASPRPRLDWNNEFQQKVQKAVGTATQVTTTTLEVNMNRFLRFVGRMFKQVDRQIGADSDMTLDEVELSIEISGKGEIKLVAGAEAKSAITLKFKRVEKKP